MSAEALTISAFLALAAQCAPEFRDPHRLADFAAVESGRRVLALNVNGAGGGPVRVSSMAEAVAVASRLIAQGRSVDLGLMQLNAQHIGKPGFPRDAAEALDPCRNVAAGAAVLADADRAASCIYNTGKPGCRNGYPEKVQAAAAARRRAPAVAVAEAPPPRRAKHEPPPSWDTWAVPLPAPEPEDEPPDGGTDAPPPGEQPRVTAETE